MKCIKRRFSKNWIQDWVNFENALGPFYGPNLVAVNQSTLTLLHFGWRFKNWFEASSWRSPKFTVFYALHNMLKWSQMMEFCYKCIIILFIVFFMKNSFFMWLLALSLKKTIIRSWEHRLCGSTRMYLEQPINVTWNRKILLSDGFQMTFGTTVPKNVNIFA